MSAKRIVIVGGVAGGASAAARARRLSEAAEIVVFERGPHVSFASCGLPYYVGGEIHAPSDLLVQTPEALKARFNLDVRIRTEVIHIDPTARRVEVRDLRTGMISRVAYDALLLSPGAVPVKPPIPGIDRPGHFTVRNVPDAQAITAWIGDHQARRAVVVGGGYIGLEMTEQLRRLGLEVALIEALPQVLGMLDPEMAAYLHRELRANGVDLHLADGVAAFDAPQDQDSAAASVVVLKSGVRLPADLVILGMGVRPEVGLAREAGLEIGTCGGIRVNARLQTSDPDIWAVGDAIEVRHAVTGDWMLIPLAGPANRQGRIAADNMLGRPARYGGTWGTGILRLFEMTAGATGASETMLCQSGIPYEAVHLHPLAHAGYYPNAAPIAMKVLFAPDTGKILGAQVVGHDGADKRMDVLATALQSGLTMSDLAALELAYSPPIGSAKDPVNMAGMIGEDILAGDVEVVQWHEVASQDPDRVVLLDVRQPEEWEDGCLPGAVRIALPELRARLTELPRDREIVAYCRSGQRSYFACRILKQHGFRCRNLTGAYLTWRTARDSTTAQA
jgi:NADPH-dependent 2,4-dienoyl-CoA reductase/sulfur reductase-like enzyme/rhodanese-related sulfurtransferase